MPNVELRSEWANTRKNQGFGNVLKRDQVNVGGSGVNKRNLPLTTGISRSSPSQPVFDGSFAAGPSLVTQNANLNIPWGT